MGQHRVSDRGVSDEGQRKGKVPVNLSELCELFSYHMWTFLAVLINLCELKILMMQSEPDIFPTTPSPLFGLIPPALPNPSHCSIPASPHPVGVRQLYESPAAVQPDPLTGLWNGSL